MAFDVQIVVDSARPHELADWWAEVLGWPVEPQDEAFIQRMVDAGHASADDTVRHRGALVWRAGAALNSPDPGRPRLLFQTVPEGKSVKNRLHLDVRVGAERREAEAWPASTIRWMNASSCGSTGQPSASAHQSASSCGRAESTTICTSKAMTAR